MRFCIFFDFVARVVLREAFSSGLLLLSESAFVKGDRRMRQSPWWRYVCFATKSKKMQKHLPIPLSKSEGGVEERAPELRTRKSRRSGREGRRLQGMQAPRDGGTCEGNA